MVYEFQMTTILLCHLDPVRNDPLVTPEYTHIFMSSRGNADDSGVIITWPAYAQDETSNA